MDLARATSGSELRPRGTPLEFWFVTVRRGELALLVDWIVRRTVPCAEVRVSLWVRGRGEVLRVASERWHAGADGVQIAGCALTPERAVGEVDRVRWDLEYAPGPWLLDPAPVLARALHPFDLMLVARPRARFTGTVTVDGETFAVDDDQGDAEGTVVHYWGRRLPDSWVWVSAGGVGDGGACVEAALFRSRLWGASGTRLHAGYVALDEGGWRRIVVAPAYGRITVDGSETAFALHARTLGRALTLTARARRATYNDLGEGIHQTLLGDVTVDGVGTCVGRAGLEVRGPLLRTPWAAGA